MKTLIPFVTLFALFTIGLNAQDYLASLDFTSDKQEAINPIETKSVSEPVISTTSKKLYKRPEFVNPEISLQDYLEQNLIYPEVAKAYGAEGEAIVKLIISSDGNIEGHKILKSAHPLLDRPVANMVNLLPKLNPAIIEGRPSRSILVVPIRFSLR